MKNFLSVIRNHDTLTNTAKDALSVFEIFTSKCVKGLHTKKHFLLTKLIKFSYTTALPKCQALEAA